MSTIFNRHTALKTLLTAVLVAATSCYPAKPAAQHRREPAAAGEAPQDYSRASLAIANRKSLPPAEQPRIRSQSPEMEWFSGEPDAQPEQPLPLMPVPPSEIGEQNRIHWLANQWVRGSKGRGVVQRFRMNHRQYSNSQYSYHDYPFSMS